MESIGDHRLNYGISTGEVGKKYFAAYNLSSPKITIQVINLILIQLYTIYFQS